MRLPMVDLDGALQGSADASFDRRSFLRLAGFTLAGVSLEGCQRAPVHYAVPFATAPEDVIPGRSLYYASVCGGCSAGCGVLIKNRDGRPIKLEGNPQHPLSRGGLCSVGQASILGLYDRQRLQHPLQAGQRAEWSQVDSAIRAELERIHKQKKAVRFLTGPLVSPATTAAIRRFLASFPDARHVVHDPRSCAAILEAHLLTHGARVLPHFHFDRAQMIVSFGADFLGGWISPVEFTAAYREGRRFEGPSARCSYHVQLESMMTLTGTKADRRECMAPRELAATLTNLAIRLAQKAGVALSAATVDNSPVSSELLDHLVNTLWQNQKRSLILCGSQDVNLQTVCNLANHLLGNYGTTVDLAQPSYQREDDDGGLQLLLQELHDRKVGALFIHQSNPVHDLPGGSNIAADLEHVPLVVSLSPRLDETSQKARYVCPEHNFLEGWSDAEPVNGVLSMAQPAIAPFGDTRSVLESLAIWMGKPASAYGILREHWEKEVFPRRLEADKGFEAFWDLTLSTGLAQVKPRPIKVGAFDLKAVRMPRASQSAKPETLSLILYSKTGMPDASHAYNPWLHELPDPITKVTWDNYVSLSPSAASRLGLIDGDMVRLETTTAGNRLTLELPAFVQPGQHDHVAAVALGYGSVLSKRFHSIGPAWLQANPSVGPDGLVGKNAAPWLSWHNGTLHFLAEDVQLSKVGVHYPLASTQHFYKVAAPKHLSLPEQKPGPIIQEVTLAALTKDLEQARTAPPHGKEENDLWPDDHPLTGAHWGMTIDLSACTGCSACVVACQVENNTPVVGKDEVRRQREMHWLRIDRYYTDHDRGVDVAHQPMLCQQCENAPCEVVCPVLATVHSEDGLNQQVYNRCVGTRYCANNCPYKVRHFNWFDYAHNDLLENLVLNPDVTVRSRGVMEKCTFCVQRIQEAKIEAARLGNPIQDGVIQTACQQSCPARAITFGNLNDPRSQVSQQTRGRRSYKVLGELNIKPSVSYLAQVRNRPDVGKEAKHG